MDFLNRVCQCAFFFCFLYENINSFILEKDFHGWWFSAKCNSLQRNVRFTPQRRLVHSHVTEDEIYSFSFEANKPIKHKHVQEKRFNYSFTIKI